MSRKEGKTKHKGRRGKTDVKNMKLNHKEERRNEGIETEPERGTKE